MKILKIETTITKTKTIISMDGRPHNSRKKKSTAIAAANVLNLWKLCNFMLLKDMCSF